MLSFSLIENHSTSSMPCWCDGYAVGSKGAAAVETWELVAREQIRDTLARYNWAGDGGRVDDLAATFCLDGVLEIRGVRSLRGRSEIAGFLSGVTGDLAATTADVKP